MANRRCLHTLTPHCHSILSSSNSSLQHLQTLNPLRFSTETLRDLVSRLSVAATSHPISANLSPTRCPHYEPTCQCSPEEAAAIRYKQFGTLRSAGKIQAKSRIGTDVIESCYDASRNSVSLLNRPSKPGFLLQGIISPRVSCRYLSTTVESGGSVVQDASLSGVAPRIKYKRLDKTSRHIMQILDKEAVGEVKGQREIPDIQPGYIIQLKVEVPENKRRVSILKGIVIARRNAGLHTTFRLRRLVAGVGIESLFPLYSPNIKEIKVLDKKKVRRAKLYYLRDKMNALRK